MAEGLNRVMLLGNLGADPELRMTAGGQAVLKLRLATSETYMDRDRARQERTEWHNVVIWGKRAEALAKILTKGSRIFVEGGLRTSNYEDREGNKRYRTEIVTSNILLQGRSGGGMGAGQGDASDFRAPQSNAPASAGAAAPSAAPSAPPAPDFPGTDDDDIPF